MQIKASISNRNVEVPVNNEAACFGAAILGGIGVKAITFSDISKMYKCGELYYPKINIAEEDKAFAQYLNIRKKIKEIYNLYY